MVERHRRHSAVRELAAGQCAAQQWRASKRKCPHSRALVCQLERHQRRRSRAKRVPCHAQRIRRILQPQCIQHRPHRCQQCCCRTQNAGVRSAAEERRRLSRQVCHNVLQASQRATA